MTLRILVLVVLCIQAVYSFGFLTGISLTRFHVLQTQSPAVLSYKYRSAQHNNVILFSTPKTLLAIVDSPKNNNAATNLTLGSPSNVSISISTIGSQPPPTTTRVAPYYESSKTLSLLDLQQFVRPIDTFAQFKAVVLYGSYPTSVTPTTSVVASRNDAIHSPSLQSPSRVSFPQSSIVSDKDIEIGSIVASSILFALLSMMIRPDMWFVSAIFGGFYGQFIANASLEIIQQPNDGTTTNTTNTTTSIQKKLYSITFLSSNPYTRLVLKFGKTLARGYLQIYDIIQGIWFMYRTGQLSYEYYKIYEDMDRKWKVQEKVDAWNARFVEGKKQFDQWEKDNEVARKVLAGLRTVWLVQENSLKTETIRMMGRNGLQGRRQRGGKVHSNRWVAYAQSAIAFWRHVFRALWAATFFGGSSFVELNVLMEEIGETIASWNLERVSQQIGSALAALVFVNLIGALFAVAPLCLGFLAILAGSIWPTWVRDFYRQVRKRILLDDDDKEEEEKTRWFQVSNLSSRDRLIQSSNRKRIQEPPFFSFPFFWEKPTSTTTTSSNSHQRQLVDMDNFHYYIDAQGKKRWYRVGKSPFSKMDQSEANDESSLGDIISRLFHFRS